MTEKKDNTVSTAEAAARVAEAAAGGHVFETSDKARAAFQDTGHESDQDVNVDEGMSVAALNDTRAWNANVKRTYDRLEEEISASVKSAQDHLNNVRTVQLQLLTNMTVNSDAMQKQHTAHRDIATDRTWNIDEQANMAALIAEALARHFQTDSK
jgi:hypothetical protein